MFSTLKFLPFWLLGLAVLFCGAPIKADTVIAASGQGWCESKNGFFGCNGPVSSINNPIAGEDFGSFRDWFAFSLPPNLGTITGATLSIWNESGNRSFGGFFYLSQADSISTANSLNVCDTTLTTQLECASAYNNLAGGTVLGSVGLAVADSGVSEYVDISLNGSALDLLNSNQGNLFIFGGSVVDGGFIFAGSGNPPTLLKLTTTPPVPEPGTLLLVGSGLVGLLTFVFRAKHWGRHIELDRVERNERQLL